MQSNEDQVKHDEGLPVAGVQGEVVVQQVEPGAAENSKQESIDPESMLKDLLLVLEFEEALEIDRRSRGRLLN